MSATDRPQTVAYDSAAPPDERVNAQAELQRAYMPLASDLLPRADLQPVLDYIEEQYALQDALYKAARPIDRRAPDKGMQSVYLDDLQIFARGSFFERPAPIGFHDLRLMVEQTPVLSAVVMTRARQILRFAAPASKGPGFAIRHVDPSHELTPTEQDSVRLLERFILHCGWEFNPRRRAALKRDTFAGFLSKLVRESLTYDSAPIETEPKQDPRLGIDGFYALDGSTIRLCTDEGYAGDDAIFAVQVVNGRIVTAYTHDDLIYVPRNPRADVRLAGYGLGETELLVRVVVGFLNAMTYNIKGFDDNAIPKGILHLTGEYSQEDLAAFRRYWNAMVRGINNAWTVPVMVARDSESKIAFERIETHFDEMHFARWMTFLVSIICAIYGMSPAEINFDSFSASSASTLSGSDTAEKLAASRDSGLRPLMAYIESLVSDYLVSAFSEKYVFRWVGLDAEDEQRHHEMRKLCLTLNEARAQEGLPPLAGPLGEAPINPSLIGPWLQLQQASQGAAEDPAQDGANQDGAEEAWQLGRAEAGVWPEEVAKTEAFGDITPHIM